MTRITVDEATALLMNEARMLDARRFSDWLALYTEDAEYWVPVLEAQVSPYEDLSIIHDTRAMMEARVYRLEHAMVHSQQPPSRMCRMVNNVMLLSASDTSVEVNSTLMAVEYRADRQFIYAAHVLHMLVLDGDALRIARKRIDLVNSEGLHEMISVPF